MSLDVMSWEPLGDKKNSDFFNDYRLKIYERRRSSGLDALLKRICGIVVQVDHGAALDYLEELYFMTPYRFSCARLNETHKVYFLRNKSDQPRLVVLEPLSPGYVDDLTRLNLLYPRSRGTPNARYVGEIFATSDLAETRRVLESHDIRFHSADEEQNPFFANDHFSFTFPSDITGNRVGYTAADLDDTEALGAGQPLGLTAEEAARLEKADDLDQRHGPGAPHSGAGPHGDAGSGRRARGRHPRVPHHVQLLLLGRLQHLGHELLDQCHAQPHHRRREDLAGQGLYRQQHPLFRELLRGAAHADGELRAQLRPAHAPRGLRGAGRGSPGRREEHRLRGGRS